LYQATELAEHTAKISLLEEAKRCKEQEAESWQLRVRAYPEGTCSGQCTAQYTSPAQYAYEDWN